MTTYTVISEWVEINAPQIWVWDILVDFKRYPQWNPFTVNVDTELKIGAEVNMMVHLPGRGKREQQEFMRAVDAPHTLAWGATFGLPFFLTALRTQRIEALGADRCRYRSTDELNGLLTPVIKALFARSMYDGFNNMSHALKQRAETQYQSTQTQAEAESCPT